MDASPQQIDVDNTDWPIAFCWSLVSFLSLFGFFLKKKKSITFGFLLDSVNFLYWTMPCFTCVGIGKGICSILYDCICFAWFQWIREDFTGCS